MKDEPKTLVIKDEADFLGFIAFPTLIMYDRRLNPVQKILWTILRRYARQDEYCFPGIKRIAQGLGMSERTVQEHLAKLESLGLITRKFRRGRSTIYEFEHLHDIYCGSNRKLTDDVLEMLRLVGEDWVADMIVARRDGNLPEDDNAVLEEEIVPTEGPVEDSVKPEVKVPVRRFEDVFNRCNENQEKSDKFTKRRKERQMKLAQEPVRQKASIGQGGDDVQEPVLTVRDVEEEFRLAAKTKWPENPATGAKWTKESLGIVKNLCNRFGHELTIKVLTTVVLKWDEYVDRFDLKGYPNVKLVAAFADSWFPEIADGKNIDPLSKRGRARKEREYDDATGTEDGGVTFV